MQTDIQKLLSLEPLPEDAEQQLEALIEKLPVEEQSLVRSDLHEALFVAQNAQSNVELILDEE